MSERPRSNYCHIHTSLDYPTCQFANKASNSPNHYGRHAQESHSHHFCRSTNTHASVQRAKGCKSCTTLYQSCSSLALAPATCLLFSNTLRFARQPQMKPATKTAAQHTYRWTVKKQCSVCVTGSWVECKHNPAKPNKKHHARQLSHL